MKTFIQSRQVTSTILLSCASAFLGSISAGAHDGHPSGAPHVTANQHPPVAGRVQIKTTAMHRIIRSNGIPNHGVGHFPNHRNPNSIRAQNYTYRVPLNPQRATSPIELTRQPWGIAINGVLFDPGTAEYWRGDRSGDWNYEALSGKVNLGLDSNHAHVQPNGAYHYHGLPTGLWKTLSMGKPGMHLLGWAADGFPIYGPYAYKDPNDSTSKLTKMRSSYQLKPSPRSGGPAVSLTPASSDKAREPARKEDSARELPTVAPDRDAVVHVVQGFNRTNTTFYSKVFKLSSGDSKN